MPTKHFEIESYNLYSDKIEVWVTKEDLGILVTISRHYFEDFLESEDRLEWELNQEEAGEHKQTSGTMSIEEYWHGRMPYIDNDIYDYIVKNPITFRNKLETDSLKSILSAFKTFEDDKQG